MLQRTRESFATADVLVLQEFDVYTTDAVAVKEVRLTPTSVVDTPSIGAQTLVARFTGLVQRNLGHYTT